MGDENKASISHVGNAESNVAIAQTGDKKYF
jgi:hypothetical protein